MPDFENFVRLLKSGDYETAYRQCRYDMHLLGLETLNKYTKSKNDIYLELYGIELGLGKFEIQDILNTYNNAICEICNKRYSTQEQPQGEIVCQDCYEILKRNNFEN